MRSFERVRGRRVEVLRVARDRDRLYVFAGPLNAEVTTEARSFPDEAAAAAEADRLAAGALGQSFAEVSWPHAAGTRGMLEAALVADPDDVATHSAYADLLMEQGDPRGEFIRVQLALEDASVGGAARADLRHREWQLLQSHEPKWLGELRRHMGPSWAENADSLRPRFTWRRGWIDSVVVPDVGDELVNGLHMHPMARLLAALAMENDASLTPRLQFPALKRLTLGYEPEDDDYSSSIDLGNPLPLILSSPLLEELNLYGEGMGSAHLFSLRTLPRLRSVRWYHTTRVLALDVLARNADVPDLERLAFHPHAFVPDDPYDYDGGRMEGYLPLRVVEPFLRSPFFPRLTHLQLRLSSLGDEGVMLLIECGWLKRLKVLDLRHGAVTDVGAGLLARCADARNLERLDLNRNRLSPDGLNVLRDAGVPVDGDDQFHPSDNPNTYLFEGEFE